VPILIDCGGSCFGESPQMPEFCDSPSNWANLFISFGPDPLVGSGYMILISLFSPGYASVQANWYKHYDAPINCAALNEDVPYYGMTYPNGFPTLIDTLGPCIGSGSANVQNHA
jgi:hypothetical protein